MKHGFGLLLVLAVAGGCRSYEQAPYPGDEQAGSAPVAGPYRVVTGDTLSIAFLYHAEWNTEMLVRPDGMMSVPFVGQISADGRTPAELQAEIQEGLQSHIQDPTVRLDVQLAERMVYVGGEVTTPGIVTFTGPTITLLEAIMKAGGPLKASADLSSVIVARVDPAGRRLAWKANLDPILTAATPPQPIHLLNRDIILVPNSPIDQANLFVDQYINRMIPGGVGIWTGVFLVGP
jgi:protein involved in polysaccharide export with SLBB domain